MFPRLAYGGFHIVGQDDELRRPAVVMGAKAHDVDLGHSGGENSEKTRGEQGGKARANDLSKRLVQGVNRMSPTVKTSTV
jgi:hypothetical protein